MSKLTRLQAKLARKTARLAEIEAVYPDVAELKSYVVSTSSGPSHSNQDFAAIAKEYRQLCNEIDAIEDEIAELDESENTGTTVAAFRSAT